MQEVRLLHNGPFEYTDEDVAAWCATTEQKKKIEALRVACEGMSDGQKMRCLMS